MNFFTRLFLFFLLGIFSIGLYTGCNIINPAERIPTYVHIDSFEFVNSPVYGTASQSIKQVYVSYNNQSLGAFDLPVTFPVLVEPGGVLQVGPGVDYNGFKGYNVRYNFMNEDTFHLADAPTQIINLQPKTNYRTSTTLKADDLFDGSTKFVSYIGDDSLKITTQPSEVFEGTGSGVFRLTSPQRVADAIFSMPIAIDPSRDAFMELNYRGNMNIEVGLLLLGGTAGSYQEYFVGFKPRADWNKVYVGLQIFAQQHPGTDYFLLIRAILPEGQASGEAFIDNLKVLSL